MGEHDEQVTYAARVRRYQERDSWVQQAVHLISHSRLATADRVLDFGCGPGRFSRLVMHRVGEVVGVDTSAEMIRLAEAVPYPRVRYAQIGDLPLPFSSEFSVIFCLHVLGHLSNLEEMIDDFRTSLIPGGRVIVLNPNLTHTRLRRPFDWVNGYKPDPTIVRRFTLADLTDVMSKSRFSCEWAYHDGKPFLGAHPLFAASFKADV